MKLIELEPLPIESKGNDYVRRCKIIRVDSGIQVSITELWFQFPKSPHPDDSDCDSYLLGTIMDAMSEGRDVVVKGSVSLGLLSNLIEYQSAWKKWLPEIYSTIDIKVDSIRKEKLPASGAICAFSGGVDATFSVWRHTQHKYHYRSQKIKLCSIVHGFDIPLANETAFENTCTRVKETLGDIDIDIVPIKTNYREITKTNWEHAFSCALVATLSNFKKLSGVCIVGSGQPYDSLVIPWGSTPITDHLLSSDDFTVIHDGASHSRTEKVRDISEWKMGIKNLRVCWEGDLKDRNCGKCEKCLRTKLNFLATGNPIPICFPDHENSHFSFEKVALRNDIAYSEWGHILEFAKKNNVEGEWVKQLNNILRKKLIMDLMLPKNSLRRTIAKKIRKLIQR